MPKNQPEIINIAKNKHVGSLHTLYEFSWSNVADKCVEATPEHIENLEHFCRDILDPIEVWWGKVTITQGIRDDEVYRVLVALHQKMPNLFAKPSATSHHFNGNAVDFKHRKLDEIFDWVIKEGLPVRELRLYKSHLHVAQFPFSLKRIKDCR